VIAMTTCDFPAPYALEEALYSRNPCIMSSRDFTLHWNPEISIIFSHFAAYFLMD